MNDQPQIEQRPIGEVTPYWRNPRLNDKAVEAVAASIRQFGMRQPIVVDSAGVIIAGHTRYRACLSLGYVTVPCVVAADLSEQQVKEYRIADNKTAEVAEWDMAALIPELREIGDLTNMATFFPDLDLGTLLGEAAGVDIKEVTAAALEKAGDSLNSRFSKDSDARKDAYLDVTCPECGHGFSLDRGQVANYQSIDSKVAGEQDNSRVIKDSTP